MSRRRTQEHRHVDYTKIADTDHEYVDAQFTPFPQKIPWKAILLASFLFVGGSTLLITGSLIVGGQIDTKYADRLWPMIILGILMFIPGAYHVRIAYYAFKHIPGYSFDDIPEFE